MSGVPTNYAELREAILDELGRADLGQQISRWIGLEEIDLVRDAKLEGAEQISSFTLAAGLSQSLPIGWREIYEIAIMYNPPVSLTQIDFKAMRNLQSQSTGGHAQHAVKIGDKFLIEADATGLTCEIYYRGTPEPLSNTNNTNALLRDAPDVLMYGALMKSAPYIGDDQRIPMWNSVYQPLRTKFIDSEWNKGFVEQSVRQFPDRDPRDRHNEGYRAVGVF